MNKASFNQFLLSIKPLQIRKKKNLGNKFETLKRRKTMKLAVTGNCELQFAFSPLADDLSNTKAKDFCKEIFLLLRKQS